MKSLILVLLTAAALAPAQTLLVLTKEGTLSIVNPATKKILGTVRVGEQPHEVEASTDGKLAFVTNYGTGPAPGNTLSVIDIAARKELHRVNLGTLQRPHGVAVAG